MALKVKVSGLREIDKALGQLTKAAGKGVLRRVGKKRAQAFADTARQLAPEASGNLKDSIVVSTKRPIGQKSEAARAFARARAAGGDGKAAAKAAGSSPVMIYIGPGQLHQAWPQELGTVKHGPQPYMRPAYDQNAEDVLDGVGDDLWKEIDKTAKRAAKRAAKKAG